MHVCLYEDGDEGDCCGSRGVDEEGADVFMMVMAITKRRASSCVYSLHVYVRGG